MHEKNNRKRKAKPRLPSKKMHNNKTKHDGKQKSKLFHSTKNEQQHNKKIIIIKKKTCIITNKIKTLQIKTNNTKTNMHNRKREKNFPARCFFVDSLLRYSFHLLKSSSISKILSWNKFFLNSTLQG